MKTIRALLLFLAILLGIPATANAQTAIDPRWGALGHMAEQDFMCGMMMTTMRWKTVNQVVSIVTWGGGGHDTVEFEMDPSTGAIDLFNLAPFGRRDRYRGYSVTNDNILYKGKPVWDNCVAIAPGTDKAAKIASLVAAGKLRAANPSLAFADYAPPAAPPPQQAAAQPAATGGLLGGLFGLGGRKPQPAAPPAAQPAQASPAPASAYSAPPRPVAPRPQATGTAQGPRIALVIGNSTYAGSLGSLANPGNDARLIAAGLRAVGFQVELVLDANQRSMKQAISRLGQRLTTSGRGSTGLFYYAGHGMQSRGVNYLIPVGAPIAREADIDLEAVAADTVLRQMEDAGASTNIVILDACRNAPVASNFRSGSRGLARMDAPNGSFLSYSTAPGSVAQDGAGRNSPFAQALAAELQKPGQLIETTFRNVRRTVLEATGGQQTPWDSSSLIDSFVFKP